MELCGVSGVSSRNINLKAFLYILVGFSGVVWFISAMAAGVDMQNIVDFVRPIPNVVTADLLLIGFFTKWGWRWKRLQGWLVPFPDLNGTWEGSLQTSWRVEQGKTPGPIPVILTIKQSFLHISCVMRTAEMESHSYVEGFCIDSDRQVRLLCYSYTSRPKVSLRDRSTPHDGTILFKILGEPANKLDGEYWTQRKTTGTVALTFRTKDQLSDLPADFPTHPMTKQM